MESSFWVIRQTQETTFCWLYKRTIFWLPDFQWLSTSQPHYRINTWDVPRIIGPLNVARQRPIQVWDQSTFTDFRQYQVNIGEHRFNACDPTPYLLQYRRLRMSDSEDSKSLGYRGWFRTVVNFSIIGLLAVGPIKKELRLIMGCTALYLSQTESN